MLLLSWGMTYTRPSCILHISCHMIFVLFAIDNRFITELCMPYFLPGAVCELHNTPMLSLAPFIVPRRASSISVQAAAGPDNPDLSADCNTVGRCVRRRRLTV